MVREWCERAERARELSVEGVRGCEAQPHRCERGEQNAVLDARHLRLAMFQHAQCSLDALDDVCVNLSLRDGLL